MIGYCLKCKINVEIKDAEEKKLRNGDIVYAGKCPTCDNTIYKKKE
jgi:hypothetical protein